MKRNEVSSSNHHRLHHIINIPRKMLLLHDNDHLAQYVLCDLSQERCFNFNKAAYFVDNPDFDCLKGVAGYARQELANMPEDIWGDSDSFVQQLQKSNFNHQVRDVLRASHKRGSYADDHLVEDVAGQLGLSKPHYCMWHMKHDNHGILMYETCTTEEEPSQDFIASGACLLGFCPVS